MIHLSSWMTHWTGTGDLELAAQQVPRWSSVAADGVVAIRVNPLLQPDAHAMACWRYGRWLTWLARRGGIFLRAQWDMAIGLGEKGRTRAWEECVRLKLVGEGSLATLHRPIAYGWLTRAGWLVAEQFGVPDVVRPPTLRDPWLTESLVWFAWSLATEGAPTPGREESCPTPFPDHWVIEAHRLPEPVHRALTDPPAHQHRHGALALAAGGPLADPRLPAVYVADGLHSRSERATLQWLLTLETALTRAGHGWDAVPVIVLAPGAARAAWWTQRERLWRANRWGAGRLYVQDVGLEEAYDLVLVR